MSAANPQHSRKWWKEAVVYEIYPASFKDSNDDGIGDIQGIISELDYLATLGVDVIWLAPHYKSPQVDMGYDISDFEDIHEPYGNLDDCLQLIDEIHKRGMKIIFDLVVNHTSDEHPWFVESRSSKDNPKRDWYFWRPAKSGPDGKKLRPNNWRSQFTLPAWTWDEKTEEYYLHLYASRQPDLNWENEECRKAIYDTAIRFWLDRGVDGFRIDTVNKYSKVPGLPDAEVTQPDEETQVALKGYTNGPRIHEFLREVRDVMDEYCKDGRDIFVVGELPATPNREDVLRYISPPTTKLRAELDMVFNFNTVDLGKSPSNRFDSIPFTPYDFISELTKWQTSISDGKTWTTTFLENHDQPRSISRFGSDTSQHRETSGKLLSLILSTLSGTLFLYQGQEIGMINIPYSWSEEEYLCVRSQNYLKDTKIRSKGNEEKLNLARSNIQRVARDHARVPMQWTSESPNGGFCPANVKPWMKALDDCDVNNVSDQLHDPDSVFSFWKDMISLRKTYTSLSVYGKFRMLKSKDELMVYVKESYDEAEMDVDMDTLLIAANLTDKVVPWDPPVEFNGRGLDLLMCNVEDACDGELKAWEGRVYLVHSSTNYHEHKYVV